MVQELMQPEVPLAIWRNLIHFFNTHSNTTDIIETTKSKAQLRGSAKFAIYTTWEEKLTLGQMEMCP